MVETLSWLALVASAAALITSLACAGIVRQGLPRALSVRLDKLHDVVATYGENEAARDVKMTTLETRITGLVDECSDLLEKVSRKEGQARRHANRVAGAENGQPAEDPNSEAAIRARFRAMGIQV